jgi:hypothetical protein
MTITKVDGLEQFAKMRQPDWEVPDDGHLKPCPFCGSEAGYHIALRNPPHSKPDNVAVGCTNTSCGVMTPRHYAVRLTAAFAWNKRTADRESSDAPT